MSVSACGMGGEIMTLAGGGNCELRNSCLVWERAEGDGDNEEVVIQAGRHWLAHEGVKLTTGPDTYT